MADRADIKTTIKTYVKWITSPVGDLLLTSNGEALTGLYLKGQKYFPQQTDTWCEAKAIAPIVQAQTQLSEYFAHQRQNFHLPLKPHGTKFQQQVWQQLHHIPFGQTISYGTLAHMIGQPTTVSRAVGAANSRNPISIIVPCHRVIASNGNLTGYAGGLDQKQWLLQHERADIAVNLSLPLWY